MTAKNCSFDSDSYWRVPNISGLPAVVDWVRELKSGQELCIKNR